MEGFFKDLLRVGISKVFIIGFGLATSIVIARHLGPEKNGTIAALLVYPSLLISLGSLGIRQSATYFTGKKVFTEDQVKRAITQIWFFTTIVTVFSCFLLMYYLSPSALNRIYIILVLFSIPFNLFNIYNSGVFLGKNDIKTFNKINWIPIAVTFLSTVMLLFVFSFDIEGYLLALVLGPFSISLLLFFRLRFFQFFSLKFDWRVIKKLVSLGIIYAISLLVIGLNYKVDIILLDYLSIPYQTGIYSRGVGVTEYLWQIPMLLSTLVFARSAISKDDIQFSKKVSHLLRLSFVVILLGSLLLFLLSDFVIQLMYGDAFLPSVEVLNILLPGVLLLTIFKVMNMDLAGKGKPWVSLKAMLPSLLVNIILNIIFIPKYGATGAALASTISYILSSILFLHFYSVEVKLPIKQIVSFHKSDFDSIFMFLNKIRR